MQFFVVLFVKLTITGTWPLFGFSGNIDIKQTNKSKVGRDGHVVIVYVNLLYTYKSHEQVQSCATHIRIKNKLALVLECLDR